MIVAPIIHMSRLSEFVPVMAEAAQATCRRWADLGPSAEIDALKEMAQLTASFNRLVVTVVKALRMLG